MLSLILKILWKVKVKKSFFKKAFKCLPKDACPYANILRRIQIFDSELHPQGGTGCAAFH